jgi:signal transduction histidine kinase
MTVISASTQLLEAYSEKYSEEDKKKHFNRIKESINSLTNLIESVYHANRLDRHEISVHKKPEAIHLIIDDLISKFEVLNPAFEFIKKYEVDREFLVNVDINLLRHIMENLLNNSIKYSANIKKVEVFISLRDEKYFEIIVKDFGIGIPYEDQDRITERFFRSKNVTNIQGTGVGLSLVKNFIEIQEGEFSFTSVPDVGSEFVVTLPI